MFKELENLVYNTDEQMKNGNDKSATVGLGGLRINAKVVEGKSLEEILNSKELAR